MKLGRLLLVSLVLLGLVLSHPVFSDVGGTVYEEVSVDGVNANTYGIKDKNEKGIAGITVTVTGTTGGGNTATDALGNWSVAGVLGDVRVEFSDIPSYFESSPVNTDSNTTVQFVSDATNNVDLGLFYPQSFTESEPRVIAIDMYHTASGNTPNGNIYDSSVREVLSFPYYSGRFQGTGNGHLTSGSSDDIIRNDIGNVFGVAVQRTTRQVFFAATNGKMIPVSSVNGIGQIYKASYDSDLGGESSTYVNGSIQPYVNVVTEGLDLTAQNPVVVGVTNESWGDHGLGGLTMGDDDKTLYTVNLGAGTLIKITDTDTVPFAGTVTEIAIPDANCVSGFFRPFGVETYRGKVFVGGVCDGLSVVGSVKENPTPEIEAKIFEYDLSTSTFNTTPILTIPVGNIKSGHIAAGSGGLYPHNWAEFPTQYDYYQKKQPMLTDFAFDSLGGMVVGFSNRAIGQSIYRAPAYMLRAQKDATTGVYTLENNQKSGALTALVAGYSATPLTDGPNDNGWFYENSDAFVGHPYTIAAGVAALPGSGEIIAGAIDPYQANVYGVRYYNEMNGSEAYGHAFSPSKIALLGDIEFLSDPAPLEIGNRVWDDTNGNGMQDENEAGINGILVTLTCGGLTATATSGADGSWIITDGDMTGGVDIPRDTSCTISVPTIEPSGNSLTTQTLNTTLGSDPDTNGSFTFTTGRSGQNNHTYDIGYSNVPPVVGCTTIINNASITAVDQTDTDATNDTANASVDVNCAVPEADLELIKTADKSTVFKGDTLIYTLTLTNKGASDATDVEVTDTLPANVTFVSATAPAGTSFDDATKVWTVPSLPAASGSNVLALQIEVTIN